ncbi:MAG: MoxR family ATPase, partial [Spirochaetales bacterium]|nr:MoxR family ATPase [Spirochaetales bacterium]
MQLTLVKETTDQILDTIKRYFVGDRMLLMKVLAAALANGHILFEDNPGLGKTLLAKIFAKTTGCDWGRIQFTPDLMPADIIGTNTLIQNETKNKYEISFQKGPVFTQILLADEINRATPKTQSALLEAMQECAVTVSGNQLFMDRPFIVLATQNPLEMEGTYPLPEAQLDRFLMKLLVDYPPPREELKILRMMGVPRKQKVSKLLTPESLKKLQKAASKILVDERIEEYIVAIIIASRQKEDAARSYTRFIDYGASTRATIYLYRCSKIRALIEGRTFVIPDDVKAVVYNVLRHRIVLSYEAESDEL